MKAVKLLLSLTAVASLFVLSSCGDDDSDDGGPSSETLTGSLGTRTLTNDRIWNIEGFVYVDNGDVVTIQPGTIIKAATGQGADATAFIVARGGRLVADGTPSQPIIFTSVNDNISVGETNSSGLPTDNGAIQGSGLWGGLVMLGRAPISAGGDQVIADVTPIGSEAAIEGIPASLTYSRYGGSNSSDDSGILDHVSIRYTGTRLAANNEVQGLTLGGVGSGTQISNVEIFASKDDGIELFGGSVNVSNLLVIYQEDDGIDIDQSYSGTINNAMVLNYTIDNENPMDLADQGALEIDGPEQSGTNDTGTFTISNLSVVNEVGTSGFAGQIKSGAQGTIRDAAFIDFANARVFEINSASSNNGGFILNNVDFDSADITNNDMGDSTLTDVSFDVTNSTKGATTSAFSWTYTNSLNLIP